MAKENQIELSFDRNQFTQDLLHSFSMNRDKIISLYNRLTSDIKANKPLNTPEEYTSIEYLKPYIESYTDFGDKSSAKLMQLLHDMAYGKDNNFTEFLQYWDFINHILHPSKAEDIYVVLNKLSVFDEKTQLAILKHVLAFTSYLNKEDIKNIYLMIYKNQFASAEDKTNAAYNNAQNHDLVREVLGFLKGTIAEELKKDFPNMDAIKMYCSWANQLLNRFEEHELPAGYKNSYEYRNPRANQSEEEKAKVQLQDYINLMRIEFDTEKFLTFGAEYIPQVQQSLEERITAQDQALRNLQGEKESLQRDNETKQRTIDNKEAEIKRLETELETEKQKNTTLTNENNQMQTNMDRLTAFLKTLKMKLATLKMGMFGNGKEFQTWLSKELDSQLTH